MPERNLREERAKRGLSQRALAKFLNIGQATVSKWENEGVPHRYVRMGIQYLFESGGKWLQTDPETLPDKPTLATGQWLKWWLDTEGVRVVELAEALGVTAKCVYGWMKPERKLSIVTEYAIRQAMKGLGK